MLQKHLSYRGQVYIILVSLQPDVLTVMVHMCEKFESLVFTVTKISF